MNPPPLNASAILAAIGDAGRRHTRPRQAIAEQIALLAQQGSDFSIEDLWRGARCHDAALGRATTFRMVEMLVSMGMLDRIAFADGSERYHAVPPGAHHHHLTCEQCHKIVEVEICVPPQQLAEVARRSGFQLSQHRIEIFGRCPDCQ